MYYGLYGAVCLLFFLWVLFPADYFADYLENMAARQGGGLSMEIGRARPSLPFGITMTDVYVNMGEQTRLKADYLKVSPGLFSLLGKSPAISFSSGIFGGKVKGKVRWLSSARGALAVEKLSVEDADLAMVKQQAPGILPNYSIKGVLSADGHYTPEGRGNGKINVNIKELMFETKQPIFTINNLNFNDISVNMDIKNRKCEIEQCVIEGNEIDGAMKGSVLIREPLERSTLKLTGTLKPEKAFLDQLRKTMPVEAVVGNQMNDQGEIPFNVSGMLGAPSYTLSR